MATETTTPQGEPVVNIVGERVALGPRHRGLLPLYYRWFNDLETFRTLAGAPRPRTFETFAADYDDPATAREEDGFVIYERDTMRPVGLCALRHIDFRNRTAEYAIVIGEADARGKGYGTEATRLMLDYAFTALGLHSVLLGVVEYNLAGRRAYEKAGFKECGRRRQAWWMGGRFWDVISMDCLASEFESPVLAKVFVPDAPRA